MAGPFAALKGKLKEICSQNWQLSSSIGRSKWGWNHSWSWKYLQWWTHYRGVVVLFPGELQHSYNYLPTSESMGVILLSFLLCKCTKRSLKCHSVAYYMCSCEGCLCMYTCDYILSVIWWSFDSQTSDNICESRAVSTSILYILVSYF